jgi:hypothetical protein
MSICVVGCVLAGIVGCSSNTNSAPGGANNGAAGANNGAAGANNGAAGAGNGVAGANNGAAGAGNGVAGANNGAAGAGNGVAGANNGAAGASSGGNNAGGSAGTGAGGSSSAGAGGSAGNATGGTGGGAAQAGSGGTSSATPAGLAVLTVPLSAAADKAHFLITLSSAVDLSAATITFHVNVHSGTGGVFQAYLQHGGSPDFAQFFQGWQNLSGLSGWQDIVWNVSGTANPSTFDETMVARLGIEIGGGATATFSATTDVLYVDSITVAGATPAAGPWTFDTTASISGTQYPAAGILWLNAAGTDTTATGATLTWLSGP